MDWFIHVNWHCAGGQMKIVADAQIPYVNEYFSPYGELVLKPGRAISKEDVRDADMLLVRSVTRVDQHLLKNSKVKFIGSVTAGTDHLDIAFLEAQQIIWHAALGFNAPPVSDYVVCVIAALQKLHILKQEKPKAAIIGVGHVGKLVYQNLQILNFDIVQCDPLRAQQEKDFTSIDLQALSGLDFISIHVPLTLGGEYPTYHFIDKDFIERQKPGCIILNASRGAVIKSQDILTHGRALHWCLDVFEHEPKIDKELLSNAIIATPHIAGYSIQSKIRGIDKIYNIACEEKIIRPQTIDPLHMPKQHLRFAKKTLNWRETVLGIFNPLLLSDMMKEKLMPSDDYALLFDEMRNQFNYRHEFAFTEVEAEISAADKKILTAMGVGVSRAT